MSLARTALRLQGKRVLLADPVIRALCQGRVYDSFIGDLDEKTPVPTIILTTEEDDAPAWSKNNGGAPFDHTCELVLEIAMTGTKRNSDGDLVVGNPVTDSEFEAYLDLIEERAVDALTVGETPEATLLRTAVTRRVPKLKSSRFSTNEGVRYAVKLVTLTVELKGEDQGDARIVPTGPYANLPEPLRSVARAMPDGYSGKATCDLIASKLPAPVAATDFLGAEHAYAPQPLRAGVIPSRETDAGAGILVTQIYDTPGAP